MNDPTHELTHKTADRPVVAAVDGSEHSLRALSWALGTAEVMDAPVVVAHVRSEALQLGAARIASLGGDPELPDTVLNAVRTVVEDRGPAVPVRYESLDGAVTEALPAVARGARLLVTGSRGRGGFASLLLGSTGRSLAARSPCPLVVVPHEARTASLDSGPKAGRVLLGLHPEETPDEAVDFAFETAGQRGVPLEAMTVLRLPPNPAALAAAPSPALQVPPPLPLADDAEDLLAEARREQETRLRPFAERWPSVELVRTVEPGDAAGLLVDASEEAALLVVGRHHRHRIAELLVGSVAHAVLHHATCPVAVVPPAATA
ncbi:universal stress protein [Streptomyces sp. CC208A]|uniref:universal stress protein n=1 Tax=Streptomyces sp. CC208A TaxID=3044573 RepID=UPI0024A7BBBE|nr:universal stress protein [Streptomyces sp. CC208A]